ncbi:hypothetical protein [Tuwongella immobilis]|uniref:Uncharacterized protein n=1 Tax=Tuwongella immobilis TaxID=692036 RepID=A0A6C2YLL3_9BACT|nr:hypothetical protein [Tuwongella immobilis]VIP02316.1 unnamed protein product [Tuwongella immobilis]VTS01034.1 unnamed protein product [Tuwongella immobilis]
MTDSTSESVDRLLVELLLQDSQQFLDGYPNDVAASRDDSDPDAQVTRWIWAKRRPLLAPALRRLLPPLTLPADVTDDRIAATIAASWLPQLQAKIADATSTWTVEDLNRLDAVYWAQSFLAPSPEWLSASEWQRVGSDPDWAESRNAMRSWLQTLILALDESQVKHPAIDAALERYDAWLGTLAFTWQLPPWKKPASFAASSGEPLPPTRSIHWKAPKGKSRAVLEIPETMPQKPIVILKFVGDAKLVDTAVMLGGLRGVINAALEVEFDWNDVKLVETHIQSLIVGSATWEYLE